MSAIAHRVEIEAPPEELFDALVNPAQLTRWWTPAQHSETDPTVLEFLFGEDHVVTMRVEEEARGERLVWQCLSGPWADKGQFEFDLETIDRGTNLRFTHHGWTEMDDFFRHCNSKWGFFLAVSLKGLLERGVGQPSPHDPAI